MISAQMSHVHLQNTSVIKLLSGQPSVGTKLPSINFSPESLIQLPLPVKERIIRYFSSQQQWSTFNKTIKGH